MPREESRYLINEDPIFFLPTLAVGIGLNEAILLQKIHGWLQCTPKDRSGRNWIYNSYRSWHEQLPFMSESTIKRAIKNLIDEGIVLTENFNENSFDKTLWYSIDYDKLNETVEKYDSVKMTLPLGQNDTSIVSKWTDNTNNNYNNKENINNINIINTKERFKKPTLEEVEEYCKERNSCVNPKTFYEYFETGGWVDSKGNKVKNWKQKIITWENNRKKVYGTVAATPVWFEEATDLEKTTEEEQKEMEEILNGIC